MKELLELSKFVKYQESDGDGCVFISYQKNSFDDLKIISEHLEKNGIKTWYAPRNIKIGEEWPGKLVDAISKCKAVLLLYTKEAERSKHVTREILIADEKEKPVVWLKLDETSPSGTLMYYVSLYQAFSFRNESEALDKLTLILSSPNISKEYLLNCKEIESTSIDSIEIQQWIKDRTFVLRDLYEAGECVARIYFSQAKKRPGSTILLPTGRSAKEVFSAMIRISNEYNECPFGEAYLMNDTETFGVSPQHITSRIKTINDFLIAPLNNIGKGLREEQLTFFSGICNDDEPEEKARKQIEKHPVSISGISISPYGEIIGYDFGQHSDEIINDGPRTIDINNDSKIYIDERQKTNTIYSVGIKTLLESEVLLILAFDKEKAKAITTLFKGEITPNMPVTLLKKHKNIYVILTKDVAEAANLLNYCTDNLSPEEVSKCVIKQ